eukprot:768576-Hanusia_phi.AAC.10
MVQRVEVQRGSLARKAFHRHFEQSRQFVGCLQPGPDLATSSCVPISLLHALTCLAQDWLLMKRCLLACPSSLPTPCQQAAARMEMEEYERAKQEFLRAQKELEKITVEMDLKEAEFELEMCQQARAGLESLKTQVPLHQHDSLPDNCSPAFRGFTKTKGGGCREESTSDLAVDTRTC